MICGSLAACFLVSQPEFHELTQHESCREHATVKNTEELFLELTSQLRTTALLKSCGSLLGWDEQTYLPPQGAEHRAEQLSLLAGMTHERAIAPRIKELLEMLEEPARWETLSLEQAAIVREARHRYDRQARLPQSLVEEISRTTTLAQQAWVAARKQQAFAEFLPWLEKVIALKREEAQALGDAYDVLYDALLDDYEPGATTEMIASAFDPLRKELVQLLGEIQAAGHQPDIGILSRHYPVDQQREFGTNAAQAIGFDFDAGRLDVAAHPFCSGIGPGDCRLTTRYDAHHFPGAFFGTLHEAGHGMYEQGLPREHFGTALGEAASLGIHESQSRLWENLVGRSRSFWSHFFPQARQVFPEALADVHEDDFYAAINDVRPSWIRVEADEATYNLHIMLRFDLEQSLISGDLAPADLPAVWNETFHQYFGMTPPNDALGCLQDVHWSCGLIGYFPTYALGNMYAAQLFESAQQSLGDLDGMFAQGEFQPLLNWLRDQIHARGTLYRAAELIQVVTGRPLSSEALLRHLNRKFRPLYGIEKS